MFAGNLSQNYLVIYLILFLILQTKQFLYYKNYNIYFFIKKKISNIAVYLKKNDE
jgi:hypothetical protein